ncbi:hypothetical protein NE236_22885 [Actinoallomurus purpureus]|uniref:hypothetical protein n=1 Tax=Actinoallomurus purpureus TaxID=478114 RepID=UPI002093CDBD|nr:hypothetical protein [Actinoallomurus purpureus]MCO6007829.1 hypothetical protein [Actinoallomurus purpureus]
MKLSTTLAVAGVAGAIAAAGLASAAQAAVSPTTKPGACSVVKDRLVLAFAHGYVVGKKVDQPLSISTKGKKTCLLSGRPEVEVLDKHFKVIGDFVGAPGKALVGPKNEAVFHLTYTTRGKHTVRPAYVLVKIPHHGGKFAPVRWHAENPSSRLKVGGFKPFLD